MDSSFIELSRILTGFQDLRPALAELYYDKLKETLGPELEKLLTIYEHSVKGKDANLEVLTDRFLWSDPAQRAVCTVIIELWYMARLDTTPVHPDAPVKWVAPEEAYFESLLWKAVGAHPPALSGGYVGYWRYEPEN